MLVGTGASMGVPPGASVIVARATMTEVVVVGTAMITVVPDPTNVSETAPGGGKGFGSAQGTSHCVIPTGIIRTYSMLSEYTMPKGEHCLSKKSSLI